MKKIVRSIIALGTGAAFLGATMAGALAYDLSQYPAPFVQNGQFNGYIVVGQNAKASDVIGATSIGMALQAANVIEKPIQGTEQTVVEGGQQIETSSNKLYYGYTLSHVKESFTDSDFPNMLASGNLVADDGTEYPYSVVIKNPGFAVKYGKPGDETNPMEYLDTSSGSYEIDINFNKVVNMSKLTGKEITLFGKTYTIGSASEVNANKLTLYSASVDQTFPAVGTDGPATTVDVGGKKVSIKVEGVAVSGGVNTAVIDVNGESRTVEVEKSYIIGGQRVYVKGINVMQIPTSAGSVRLFIGSNKIEFNSGGTVKTGDSLKNLDGVEVIGNPDFNQLTSLKIQVTPKSFDDQVEYIKAGSELVDPLFGAFKYQFTGETPAYTSDSREKISITPDGSKKIKISFVNRDGQEISWSPWYYDSGFHLSVSGDHPVITDCHNSSHVVNATTDDYFVLNVKGGYTHVLQLTKIRHDSSNGYNIDIKDVATGQTQTFTYDSSTRSGVLRFDGIDVPFNVTSGYDAIFLPDSTEGTCSQTLYTKQGASIVLATDHVTVGQTAAPWKTYTSEVSTLSGADGNIAIGFSWSTSNNKVTVDQPSWTTNNMEEVGDSHDYTGVTHYGTYIKYNDNSYKVELDYYKDATKYNVFLAPTEAVTKTTSTGLVTQQINPISPTVAVLDSEVTDPMEKNLIVVGGPCVNTVAATLMGNPSDCTAGFEEGKAIIKLFNHDNGKVALLVAGYSAMDTRRAAMVLADYKDYASNLKGTEVVVSGTDLTNINIEAPAPATNEGQ